MRRRLLAAGGAWALGRAFAAVAQESAVLRLGVVPNVSARVLVANYQPIRQYLERVGARPVEIRSAPDFRSFNARTLAGEFDLVVTPAHLGRLAQLEGQLVPLVMYQPLLPALLVTPKARPAGAIEALRGRRLAVANPQSMVAMEGMRWLRARGLMAERDFSVVHARNEDSLAHLLLAKDADVPFAMLSGGELRQLPEGIGGQLVVFTTYAEVPSFLVLAHARLGAERIRLLRAHWLQLPGTDEGRRFFEATGITGVREPTDAELRKLDAFVGQTRQLLGQPS